MPLQWPIVGKPRRAWSPAENARMFVVPLPPGLKVLEEEEYHDLLGRRVQWMYERAGRPRGLLERLLLEAGDSLAYLSPREPELGESLVYGSPALEALFVRASGLSRFPAKLKAPKPEEQRLLVETVLEVGLHEWLAELAQKEHLLA